MYHENHSNMSDEPSPSCVGVIPYGDRNFILEHSNCATRLIDMISHAVYVLVDDGGFSQWSYLLSLPEPLSIQEVYCLDFETCETETGILHCTLIVRCVMAACNWSGLALDDTPRIFSAVFKKV